MYNDIDGVKVWGVLEEKALEQMLNCKDNAVDWALMADHHKGYAVPIGGVVAYKDAISPSGVGYDIACGNKAVRLDTPAPYIRENIARIMDKVFSTISFGVGRNNEEPIGEQPIFEREYPGWELEATKPLKRMA